MVGKAAVLATSDCDEYRAVCGWLESASPHSGILLADEADGWSHRSYREIADQALRMASELSHAAPTGSGESNAGICIVLPTDYLCVSAIYAAWAAGAGVTLVPPPVFGGGEEYERHLSAILVQAQPRLVVTSAHLLALVTRVMRSSGTSGDPIVADQGVSCPPRSSGAALTLAARSPLRGSDTALIQFTSGSSGVPKGVRISWKNLAANIAMILAAVDWRRGDTTVSWLPLYHDMGLVGGLLSTVAEQGNLKLMRPDQFVRQPLRWIKALEGAQYGISPSFGMGYTAARVDPAEIEGIDLSGLRSLISGAEPIDMNHVHAFTELLRPTGYRPESLRPAYGLAESTVLVSMSEFGKSLAALRVDSSTLRFGRPVGIETEVRYDGSPLRGGGWMLGLGVSTDASRVRVVDEVGTTVADTVLGEIVVSGDSVADGYHGESADGSTATTGSRFVDGELHSGDAGFMRNGVLYVVGRMGSSIKVRGKSVFMEDVDAALSRATGISKQKFAAVASQAAGMPAGIIVFVENPVGTWVDEATRVLRGVLGPVPQIRIVTGDRGLIRRTSSGKPRRRLMWDLFEDSTLGGDFTVHDQIDTATEAPRAAVEETLRPGTSAPVTNSEILDLLDRALESVDVPAESTFVLEGSIAEGFGNDGSDIDFLALVPGSEHAPDMPSVLFVGGRRVEIRTRSTAQVLEQFEHVRQARSGKGSEPASLLELDQDVLNRCQRFLRSRLVRQGSVDVDALRLDLPYDDFGAVMANWWRARAEECLRRAVAFAAMDCIPESLDWARDGVLQAAKGWAAERGETYLESKWMGPQLDRIADGSVTDRYRALERDLRAGGRAGTDESGMLSRSVDFAAELGLEPVVNDPANVVFTRVRNVTSWPIDGRIHVLRDDHDVFVLSDRGAQAWRSVVFGRSIAQTRQSAPGSIGPELAEFVRLGLVGLRWRRERPIRAAMAMCKVSGPCTIPPTGIMPTLGIGGGVRSAAQVATLSPLPARRFVESASTLVWSNIVVENAREDLVGALAQQQWQVAEASANRMIAGAVRMQLSALGCSPLPPDAGAVSTLIRLVPDTVPRREDVIASARAAVDVGSGRSWSTADHGEALACLDEFVELARGTGDVAFPASFDSYEQWRRTLVIAYDWLRLAAYLDTELPIDEVQDLLASGGTQPHQRSREAVEEDVR
ncbi:acyl-CoA synthetase (AMP-forming)/AMP-acid ligase II [Rhodococcus sp. 27YEA15]|uniref:AMP-binding protein n=1 Tax=Rhodococcus sp. 27YEA15 TaxID=3156259 RepID=UPI003C7AB8E6